MAELQESALWLSAKDDGGSLDDPDLRYLFGYWRRAAGDGVVPHRREIDPPIDLPGFLPTTIMFNVERGAGGMGFRYRLLGTRLAEFAGRDVTGMTIQEAFGDDITARDREIYERVVGEGICYSGQRISLIHSRQFFERYRRLVMPVRGDDSGRVDMIWIWLKFAGAPRITP